MTWLDWILLAAVVCRLVYVLLRGRRKKRCCGDCAACRAACTHGRQTQ